jgi:hypothetical protein
MTRADLRFIELTPVIRANSQQATARTEACLGEQPRVLRLGAPAPGGSGR